MADSETNARDLLMDSAEILIAERGMGVSLRTIAAHAGQRNNSAVIYHFGNHDGLIAATLDRRMSVLDARRKELLDKLEVHSDYTVDDVLHAIIEPALELPYLCGSSHYARFVEQIRTHPVIAEAVPRSEKWPATMELARRISDLLPAEEGRDLPRRIRMMTTSMFALMADYERRGELDSPRGRGRASRELVAILSAMLSA